MKSQILNIKSKLSRSKDLIKILLRNRGIKTKEEIDEFLNPKLKSVTIEKLGINKEQLSKAIERISLAIKEKEQIVIYGDYDVDGICGTAILWETLDSIGAKVMPYIPHRIDEGYGLSIKGIDSVKKLYKNLKLIITTDNGVVANDAVGYANRNGIDVIITDHHVLPKKKPNALGIIHTTELCGAGIAYLLSQEIKRQKAKIKNAQTDHLELVALATVADLVPLRGANRTLLKFGLDELRKTERIGLLELFKEAGVDKSEVGVYEIGHIIAPRLNAMGRLEYAMDSLRLLCTNSQEKAEKLSKKISLTNKERQLLTVQTTEHATKLIKDKKRLKNLLIVVHESYEEGVIGLVAGKLTEEFYRPAIVISKGKKISKASARSIKGFNIIEFIRTAQEFLVDAGGHPMAAGFTIETGKIPLLEEFLHKKLGKMLDEKVLTRNLRVDCELPLSLIKDELYKQIQKLSPFGMGNPEPTFLSKNVIIEDIRLVGAEGKHLKMQFKIQNLRFGIEGIGFNMGEKADKLHIGDKINLVYRIDKDDWNGNARLQLKIKDLQKD